MAHTLRSDPQRYLVTLDRPRRFPVEMRTFCGLRGRLPRAMSPRGFAGVAALCALVAGCPPKLPPVGSRVLPARASDLPGSWLGQDEHHWGSVYRLELHPDGSGLLGISANDVQRLTGLYEVTRWSVDDGRFTCNLRPIQSARSTASFRIRGLAESSYICLDVSEEGDPTKWDPGPKMVREAEFFKDLEQKQKRALDLETRMKEHRLPGPRNAQ